MSFDRVEYKLSLNSFGFFGDPKSSTGLIKYILKELKAEGYLFVIEKDKGNHFKLQYQIVSIS